MRHRVWKVWAKALGEKASHKKREADTVALIRTVIFLSYLTTNAFIVAGVVRHWNDVEFTQRSKMYNQSDQRVTNDRHH